VLAKILSKHGFQCRGVFGSKVTILRDDDRRQTFRNVGEDEADRSRMCLRLPTTYGVGESVERRIVARSRLLRSNREVPDAARQTWHVKVL
jgi:hypothetical protein